MFIRKNHAYATLIALGLAALTGCGAGVSKAGGGMVSPSCDGYPRTGVNGVTVCQQRAFDDLAATGSASIKTDNGEILAQGASRSTLALVAYVYATALTEAAANNVASQVVIHTANNDFFATGPSSSGGSDCNVNVGPVCVSPGTGGSGSGGSWYVSFRAALPAATNLTTQSGNGDSEVDNIAGTGNFSSGNAQLFLIAPAGDVTASTGNGAIDVDFAGSSFSGNGLSATTGNGAIAFHVPGNYSAVFHLHTGNGSIHSDFSGRNISGQNAQDDETLGSGGVSLSADSNNGSISLLKK